MPGYQRHFERGFVFAWPPLSQLGIRLKDSGLDGSAVDFLSVDVEGVELMVIKSIDLAGIHYPVIIAENNGGGDAMERYLNTVG